MNHFAILLLFIQAYFLQNALGQCGCGGPGLASISPAAVSFGRCSGSVPVGGLSYGIGSAGRVVNTDSFAYTSLPEAAYGGVGEGNVAVIGELPVSGNTAVVGQVPIIGVVNFDGILPAAGSVSISGRCSCGCDK